MRKQFIVASALALALSVPLVGCSSSSSSSTDTGSTTEATETTDDTTEEDSDFDAAAFYAGQWRGSVETTGESIYGTTSGSEAMLDVNIEEDGTVTVVPLEAHADLLTDEGTWEATEDSITLHLSDRDITLTVTGSATMSGDATDFDIADFDTINFDFYG